MKTNNNVQTGAKIQLGGLKLGLFNKSYQVPGSVTVKKEPKNPADKLTAKLIIKSKTFFCFIKLKLIHLIIIAQKEKMSPNIRAHFSELKK